MYPGGKGRFYPYLSEYFPQDMEVYIEPCFGGGSVALNLSQDIRFGNVKHVIVGEFDPEVYNFWHCVQSCSTEVMNEVSKLEKEHMTFKKWLEGECGFESIWDYSKRIDGYEEKLRDEASRFWNYLHDDEIISKMSKPERAARFYISNRVSFSSTTDAGSVSAFKYSQYNEALKQRIGNIGRIIKNFEIRNCSFESTIEYGMSIPGKKFIFADPPYYRQEGSALYGKDGKTHKGFPHEMFAEVMLNTDCEWFITYDDSQKVRSLFKGEKIIPFRIPGGYVLASKKSEDALAGEEVFIVRIREHEEDVMDLL
jgi:DNA adenine methylase